MLLHIYIYEHAIALKGDSMQTKLKLVANGLTLIANHQFLLDDVALALIPSRATAVPGFSNEEFRP